MIKEVYYKNHAFLVISELMASFGKVLKSFGDISEKFTKAISYSQHNQSLLPSDRQLLKDDSSMTLCSKKLAYLQRKSIAQSVAN